MKTKVRPFQQHGLVVPGRIGYREDNHGQESTTNRTQTGKQVRQPAKEDAEAEDTGEEEDRKEEVMQHPAWLLILVGLIIVTIGAVWLLAPSIPWLGKLPGDIRIEGETSSFYFPVVTCIVLSLLLTGILWLFRFFAR